MLAPRVVVTIYRPPVNRAAWAARVEMSPTHRADGSNWPFAMAATPHRDTRAEAEADARDAKERMEIANGLPGAQGMIVL